MPFAAAHATAFAYQLSAGTSVKLLPPVISGEPAARYSIVTICARVITPSGSLPSETPLFFAQICAFSYHVSPPARSAPACRASMVHSCARVVGASGQNVNKVETGVRLRYQYKDPDTGEEEEILIENTESRKQLENRENAMRLLKSQLYDRALQKRKAKQAEIEAGKKKIEWGSQIRSYVFDDRRVKDHRTNYQTSDVNGVMDGKLDGFIKSYLMEFAGGE